MIRTIFPKLFVIVLLASMVGCNSKFAGDIEFKNSSSTELWVDVAGTDRNISCGALGAGASKIRVLDKASPSTLPAKIDLTWNIVDQAKQQTQLLLPDKARKARTGTLIFEYDAQGKWSAVYKLQDD